MRLQQMRQPDLPIPDGERGITRTKPNGAVDQWDRLVDRSRVELALTKSEECGDPVAIACKHRLVFGYGLWVSALRTQHLAFGVIITRKRAARRCRQGLLAQILRAF